MLILILMLMLWTLLHFVPDVDAVDVDVDAVDVDADANADVVDTIAFRTIRCVRSVTFIRKYSYQLK